MSEEARALIVAGVTGPLAIAVDRAVTWARNRRKDDAEAGLTVDERWEKLTDKYEERITALEDRLDVVEAELEREKQRSKGLEAEVDRYRSIARSLLRYVLKMRDALAKAHVEAPDIPPDIEDALTGIDLP